MHFLAPKELYSLWTDKCGEKPIPQRRDRTCALRNVLFLWGLVSQPVGGS